MYILKTPIKIFFNYYAKIMHFFATFQGLTQACYVNGFYPKNYLTFPSKQKQQQRQIHHI